MRQDVYSTPYTRPPTPDLTFTLLFCSMSPVCRVVRGSVRSELQNEAGLAESLQETPQKEKGKPYAAGQRERDTGKEQTSFRLPWPSGRDHPPQCLQVDLLNDTGAQLPPTGFFNEYLLHGSCETPLLCCSHLSGWSFLGSLFSRATKTKICLRKLPFCFV